MKNLIRLTDRSVNSILEIFRITDEIYQGRHKNALKGKTVVMFFPETSIRTRVTFEKGIYLLGGQSILFPTETLDKKEDLRDVFGYLNNWADLVIARHKDISVLDKIAEYSSVPVINAMTDINHPCEVISDLYALFQIRPDYTGCKYLFCGKRGNIGLAWKEAADIIGLSLEQCCPKGYEIEGLKTYDNIRDAIVGKDIIITDSLPASLLPEFANCQVTAEAMALANEGALLNPCPPFFRGEEVSADAIESEYFVGYEFKKHLLAVQQAIMLYCIDLCQK
ncbi:MAG: ornithine carbamoyltransferase [Oscillospiraceae bacterium]